MDQEIIKGTLPYIVVLPLAFVIILSVTVGFFLIITYEPEPITGKCPESGPVGSHILPFIIFIIIGLIVIGFYLKHKVECKK